MMAVAAEILMTGVVACTIQWILLLCSHRPTFPFMRKNLSFY